MDKKPSPTSLILLDENNNEQLPRLIQFMQEHGCTIISHNILQLSSVSYNKELLLLLQIHIYILK